MRHRSALIALPLGLLLTPPAVAEPMGGDVILSTQALLVIAALLSATLIVLAIFTLWQSHRTYLETVRLHQTITEAQQTFLSRVLQANRETVPRKRSATPAQPKPAPPAPPKADPGIRLPQPPTPPAPVEVRPKHGHGYRLADLDDVEFAVLEKLAQDPTFFSTQRLEDFGASQVTLSTLMQRHLVRLDGLGRPSVPDEVRAAIRACLPRN